MSRTRGVARSLAQGFTRSLALVALTGFAPAAWVAAGVFFSSLGHGPVATSGWTLGVVGACLVLFARPSCAATRGLVTRWTGVELPAAYRPVVPVTRMATGYWWNGYDYQRLRWVSVCQRWLLARTRDPASWRDVIWVLTAPLTVGVVAAAPLALITAGAVLLPASDPVAAVPAIGAGTALLPVAWRVVTPVARRFLGPSTVELLGTRIASLVQGRADLTRAQDAELHRIERDLHDGAQARLVAIGLSLGAAERLVDTDPAGTKVLLRQARETSLAALRDLRDLVHGIVPPVLLERGLVDAVRALAVDAPLRTEVRSTLEHRLETPVESALYFATSEIVTNAVKHSGGTAVDVTIDRTRTGVAITVSDDGRGGADKPAGSGLVGVESRLAALGGSLRVDSPPGGPTTVTVEVPCGSS
ncbi:sensor histidine kinase [Umezawaea endophytica]|uniref:histidine kinase n=1 Tax=Umezawaea endophytica TaxID=1654476 RepID=A0A9X2VJX7_9PSEU|nr:sensor histidine kinase [Umezawaea endophytica]MCS7478023.1 sensor histidine kinase [Umezawaea endophytica]